MADNPPSSGSSGAVTPTSTTASSSFNISSSLYGAFGGLIRRLSSDPAGHSPPQPPAAGPTSASYPARTLKRANGNGLAHRHASPMRPPPLESLTLSGFADDTPLAARLLTPAVAEEIRIMVPERLRIEDEWKLVYSLDQDGASLGTLYQKCAAFEGRRGGFVLVVRDEDSTTFGAYLSEFPHPSPHYVGTGECFLWRASLHTALPPPPSADTSSLAGRSTTIASTGAAATGTPLLIPELASESTTSTSQQATQQTSSSSPPSSLSPTSTPASSTWALPPPQPPSPSIRFKAFPYSGINEYYLYCEAHTLSVGGGDGRYGLWLDDGLERGVSATCLTFGNEPLSDEGEKFHVLGVEVWVIGAKEL